MSTTPQWIQAMGNYPYKWIKHFYSKGAGYDSEPHNADGESIVDETLVEVKGTELKAYIDQALQQERETIAKKMLDAAEKQGQTLETLAGFLWWAKEQLDQPKEDQKYMTTEEAEKEILRKEHIDPFHYPGHKVSPTSKDCPLCPSPPEDWETVIKDCNPWYSPTDGGQEELLNIIRSLLLSHEQKIREETCDLMIAGVGVTIDGVDYVKLENLYKRKKIILEE